MNQESFQFSLTDQEKDYLKNLVRESILQRYDGTQNVPQPPTDTLRLKFGAFVTLKSGGDLRGCIGHIVGDKPLFQTIWEMARAAAFQDPRFPPLPREEAEQLDIEISILSPLEPCPDVERIEPGRHGLLIRKGPYSGLLLPQVASEHGWDRDTFLAHTCQKAGLRPGCHQDPVAQMFWFEAEVF
ncbi:AmmeMemoRadiSam system protein A [Desulfohalovibrio reitneri]|uniref:AmmeMemoRadiSam system protein A n=1 Tax=Desulfohalovibrio reitneri TaxID=1307759 RepID=UPI0004A73827|nr:AmmeMemoRadiSam system protein A [Desulfohalovibrio reitneri]